MEKRGNSASGLLRGNGRPAEVVEFEAAVVSFFIDAADMLGIPKSVAAIYGICFASPEPLSFADIHERLDVSQGSISQGLRVLREVGALKMVEPAPAASLPVDILTRHARTARYEPDLELRKLVVHYLENRLARQLELSHGALKLIAQQVPTKTSPAGIVKSRLAQLQNWHDKTRALLPLAKTFLKLT